MGCGASKSLPVSNTLTEQDREWIKTRLTSATKSRVEPTVPPKQVSTAIQTNKAVELVNNWVQTEDLKSSVRFTEVAIQTEDIQAESFSEEEDEDEDGVDNGLDIDAKNLLHNMLLVNMEVCGTEDDYMDVSDNIDISNEDEVDEDLKNLDEEGKEVEAPPIKFQPNFADFPSHITLRRENARYAEWKKKYPEAGNLCPGYPDPDPTQKIDLFKSEDFMALDQYVLQTPLDFLDKPLSELVTYLTRSCKSDLEKARVTFRWCCAQDLSQLSGSEGNDTPRHLLLKCKSQQGFGYTQLYERMCSLAGLDCNVVTGTVKAAGYKLGQEIDIIGKKNDWIVVKIDGKWRIVDLLFAAQQQTGGDHGEWELIDDNGKGFNKVEDAPIGITYNMNEFYFLTDPEEFIYNHFPDNEGWQLLARPVTKDEFMKMAYLRGLFFEMDMDVRQAKRCTIPAPSGETMIKLGLPTSRDRLFMYRLWKSSKDGNMDFDKEGTKLVQFVYMEQIDSSLAIRVLYPTTGKYKVDIYIKDNSKPDTLYKFSVSYLLLCTQAAKIGAFPRNQRHVWGPGIEMAKLGMTPDYWKYGTIETENGEAEVIFTCTEPVEILAKLRTENKSDEKLAQWVLWRAEDGKIIINLKVQESGTYALDIYAKQKVTEGTYPHMCTYLVNASSGVPNKIKFPAIAKQYAGETDDNSKFKIVPVSHKQAYFTSLAGQEDLIFQYPMPTIFSTQMMLQLQGDLTEKIERHTFCTQTTGRVCFKTRFPKAGIYRLTIFAKEEGSDGLLPCVFNYVISVPVQMENCRSFPQQFNKWGIGCTAEALEDGEMAEGEEVEVNAIVPNALDVAIIKGKDWTHLKQDENGRWVGTLNTGEPGQSVKLSAKYKDEGLYETLIQNEVKGKEDMSAKKKQQGMELKLEKQKKENEENEKLRHEEEIKNLEKELQDAIEHQDLKRLRRAVARVEELSCTNRLMTDYNKARNIIKSIERMARLKKAIMQMNQSSMAEIKSYNKPPKPVHDIMSASLLLMRKNEEETKDWITCKTLCNSNVLKRNVKNFNLKTTSPEIASRTLKILKPYRLDDVAETSAVAACFYAWSVGMAEELNLVTRGEVKKVAPAKLKRQKEIFSINASV